MSIAVGDKLVEAGVNLRNTLGGTEFGTPFLSWDQIARSSTKPDLDWYWFHVSPDANNIRFVPQGDGSYELVIYVSAMIAVILTKELTVLAGRRRLPTLHL